MNYKAGYLHMFNQLTALMSKLERLSESKSEINVPMYIKQMQSESEEICIGDEKSSICRAPRSGSTK